MYVEIAIIIVLIVVVMLFGVREGPSFYETGEVFPSLMALENTEVIETITKELSQLNSSNWQEWPERKLSKDNKWTVFPLCGFGKWSERNCSKCPKTAAMLKKIPGIVTAGFSKLEEGAILEKHQGWAELSNHVLRNHLLLTDNTPESCSVWVAGQIKPHVYRKWITFDDSKLHTAMNKDEKERIVLLVDIERPEKIMRGKSKVVTSNELENFLASL